MCRYGFLIGKRPLRALGIINKHTRTHAHVRSYVLHISRTSMSVIIINDIVSIHLLSRSSIFFLNNVHITNHCCTTSWGLARDVTPPKTDEGGEVRPRRYEKAHQAYQG